MNLSLLLLSLIILTNTTFAQNNLHLTKDSDTVFWYNYKNNIAGRFKLGFIENDTTDFSFRFWSFGLVIKVSSITNHSFGEIVRFVEANTNGKKKKTFTKHYPITESQAMQVRLLIDSLQIEGIPSDKNIKGWKHGFDGIEYLIEYKKKGQYTFKNYWSPNVQDTLNEAVQFQNFVIGLGKIFDLRSNSESFQRDIPFDSWINPGGGGSVIRIKPKQKKKNGG